MSEASHSSVSSSRVIRSEVSRGLVAGGLTDYCVVIPAHNAAEFIAEAIASVRAQSIGPLEIVVVDDASTDDTAEISRSLGVRVECLRASRGPSVARNCGVALTTAPVIAFLDADDEWYPHHAEHLLTALGREAVVFVGSDAERFGSQNGHVAHGLVTRAGLDLPDLFILENPIIQSAVMILRSAFDAVGGYDERLRFSEDYDLWTRMIDVGCFGYVGVTSVRRRMHPAQLTYSKRSELVRSWSSVRRRALQRRLTGAHPKQRELMLSLLDEAIRTEIDWAIWTGNLRMLDVVRNELDESDSVLGLQGRLRENAGSSRPMTRLLQDARCVGRGLLNSVLQRDA